MTGIELINLKSSLKNLGCKNENDILITYYVHQELTQVQLYFNVSYQFNNELNLLYLRGQRLHNDPRFDIFIPIPINFILSPVWLKKLFSIFTSETDGQSIILSYVEKDSSIIFHRVAQGLIPPLSPNSSRKLEEERNKETIQYLKTLENKEKTTSSII